MPQAAHFASAGVRCLHAGIMTHQLSCCGVTGTFCILWLSVKQSLVNKHRFSQEEKTCLQWIFAGKKGALSWNRAGQQHRVRFAMMETLWDPELEKCNNNRNFYFLC